MLQWLGIIILAGLIIGWAYKRNQTGSCCSGCDSCPLECSRRKIESKESSTPAKPRHEVSDIEALKITAGVVDRKF